MSWSNQSVINVTYLGVCYGFQTDRCWWAGLKALSLLIVLLMVTGAGQTRQQRSTTRPC